MENQYKKPVIMSEERVASLESEVRHINNDISEIKSDVSDIRQINGNIEKSLAKLTLIAELNQSALPKIEARVSTLERWRWLIVGGFAAVIFVVSYSDKIKLFLSS